MNKTPQRLTTGVRKAQRIVVNVRVAIEPLGAFRELNNSIGLQEAAQHGIVHTGVHVDEAYFIVHFMTGESARGETEC